MIYNIKYTIGILVIIVFQSCNVALKNYESIDPYELENYRVEQIKKDTSSLADLSWSDLFKDTILQEHIKQGLSENIDVLVAQENIKIASAYIEQSKAAFYPTAGAELSYAHTTPSTAAFNFFSERVDYGSINLDGYFSWEADIWGKLKSDKKATIASYLQTESYHLLVKSQLVANIAKNYYLLLSLDAKKDIIESTISNREESIQTIVALKNSGDVTEVAVQQNKAQLYTAQALLIDVEKEIKIRENALSILLGKTPDNINRSELKLQQLPIDLNIGIPIKLLSHRPDVLAAEYNLVNAFELTNVARTRFYPTLSISGSAGLNSQNFNNLFSANALFGNILGNLTQPIFNQRKLRTQKEVRLSEQEIALLDYKSSILNAYREVSDGVYTYKANEKKMIIKEQQFEALDKAIEFSEELLIQGMADYLEVLTAKDNLLQTQLEMVDIELNKLSVTVDLYRALGGGWK